MTDGTPARILLHAPNPLGDAVMAEPALRAIATRFPDAHVTVLITHAFRDLPHAWTFAHRVITLRPPRRVLGHLDQMRVVRSIRAGGHDLAVLCPNSRLAASLAVRGRVRRIVGYARDGRDRLLTDAVPFADRRDHEHMVVYYWRLAEAVGGPPLPVAARLTAAPADTRRILAGDEHTRPRLRPTLTMRRAAGELLARYGLQGRPYVAIAPTTAFGPAKEWPVEHFAELCRRLGRTHGLPMVLLGVAADAPRCATLVRRCPDVAPLLVDLAGATPLGTMVGILAGASAFVGNDSGPAHLAAALGTPGVALFGSTSLIHSGPVSESLRTLHHHLPCSPCFQRVCPLTHLDCLRQITPEEVAEALHVRIRSATPPAPPRPEVN